MSSIYVYLSKEVEKKEGYEEKQRGKDSEQYKDYSIAGMHIFRDKGKPYIMLGEVENSIPEVVSDIVVGVSLHDWIPLTPKRIKGVYKLKSATAIVDLSGDRTEVRITAEKIEDLRELYYKIRTGQILPSENWEAEQITESPVKKKCKGLLSFLRS